MDLETDTFIHHFWLSKYDYLPAKQLFKKIKKEIIESRTSAFLADVISDSTIYRSIHESIKSGKSVSLIHFTSWKSTRNQMIAGIIGYDFATILSNHNFLLDASGP